MTVKEETIRLIADLPEDVTLEEIQHRLHMRAQIARGLADIEAGRTHSQEDVEARVQEWKERAAGQQKL